MANKDLCEVVFILDRSGSMSGLEADTIGGFNATLAKQKKEPGEVLWSTVLFDDKHEVVHDRVPIAKIEKLTENEYYVRGCTALLDAVGRAIRHIGNIHQYAREEDVPEKTIFVITTDGLENASRRFRAAEYDLPRRAAPCQPVDPGSFRVHAEVPPKASYWVRTFSVS